MRPDTLFPLFADVSSLKGVGPKIRTFLEKLCGTRVKDLLFHLPHDYLDRRFSPNLYECPADTTITVVVTVEKHHSPGRNSRVPYKITCSNNTGSLQLVFFHANRDWLKQQLPEGAERVISGKADIFDGIVQIVHPDYIAPVSELEQIRAFEPQYPLTAGLSNRYLVKLMHEALKKLPSLPEWIEANFRERKQWPEFHDALERCHTPKTENDIENLPQARERLAYDEILANQLALAIVRQRMCRKPGPLLPPGRRLREKLMAALPFTLTGNQETVIDEIAQEMTSGERMLRLLQGDVGSGKTVVALIAMLQAVEAGKQAALMAPTEIVSRQHADWVREVTAGLGLRVGILTGRDKGKPREALLKQLREGDIDILIGTHALFQESVEFRDLALIVIDEQHRFGVRQRLELASKGQSPHILLMTATPIPRSLTMTYFGDMDSSQLREKPAGRKPVDTRTIPMSKREALISRMRNALEKGEKIYWICPLVEESEDSDLAAAEARFREFEQILGEQVGLVHGRMKGEEKDAVMQRFVSGEVRILVATTVIEVGVNVPDATIMIIEHAERFGLAQLHQLRGRVGRGDKPSSCVLLYGEPLSETGKARLSIMRETEDGFRIAEEDLKLRGSGEILGTKQSGFPAFKFADIAGQQELVLAARDDTKLLLHRDPKLESERGNALRHLLYLFDYDQHIKNLQSG